VDICPIDTLNSMVNDLKLINTEKLLATKNKISNYIAKREEFQKLIRSIIKKLKFDPNTLHLTNYYLDLVQLQNPELKMDLSAVTCLFIAGI